MQIRNRTSAAHIASGYIPIIQAAKTVYREAVADSLVSIRLLGSVPRGDAVPGKSDIDFVALATLPPTRSTLAHLATAEQALTDRYPIVAHVDLEVIEATTVPEARRFILATDSLLVYGSDDIHTGPQTIDRLRLVELVTPPASEILPMWITAIESETNPETLRRYCRTMAKDVLKILRGQAIRNGGPYENNVARIFETVMVHVPEQQEVARQMFALYNNPSAAKQVALDALRGAERALL